MALICFNLDGTLVDPLRAMEHCTRLACAGLGLPAPSREQLAAAVGRSQEAMFAGLPGLDHPDRLAAALEGYWSRFAADGIVRHRIYEGSLLMLTRLKHQGHRLYAVTLKPARYARQVLHHFDLLLAFEDVFGGAVRPPWLTKAQVLAAMREQGVLEPGGFMVGDGPEDMAAARDNGLIPLGVTYGFGDAEALRQAGARELFPSVTALDDWFKENLREPEILDSFSRSE
jgi:phosphoglycolate phosphatase